MIRLNVFIQVSQGSRTALLEVAKELVEHSLKDAGCIAYDFFESSTRNDVFLFCETWENEETMVAHTKAPHFVKLFPKIQELCTLKMERFDF